jgi:hypothetical protein
VFVPVKLFYSQVACCKVFTYESAASWEATSSFVMGLLIAFDRGACGASLFRFDLIWSLDATWSGLLGSALKVG